MRVIVLGAGVIGVTTAYYLAKAGHYLELSAVAALTALRILHAKKSSELRHAVLIGTSHGYKETPD